MWTIPNWTSQNPTDKFLQIPSLVWSYDFKLFALKPSIKELNIYKERTQQREKTNKRETVGKKERENRVKCITLSYDFIAHFELHADSPQNGTNLITPWARHGHECGPTHTHTDTQTCMHTYIDLGACIHWPAHSFTPWTKNFATSLVWSFVRKLQAKH